MVWQDDPTKSKAWQLLKRHAHRFVGENFSIVQAFLVDSSRVERFSFSFCDELSVDLSKNMWDEEVFSLLLVLADQLRIVERKAALFRADAPVVAGNLQAFLRDPSCAHPTIGSQARASLDGIRSFSGKLHDGMLLGYTGRAIKHVVHVGIGGSYLAIHMALTALDAYKTPIGLCGVSNVDPQDCQRVIQALEPETTLFIISSKSFATPETLTNTATLLDWFCTHVPKEGVAQHFFAITAHAQRARSFGIPQANIFLLPEVLSGRFSWCSAAGLPIACSLGFAPFRDMLLGARAVDEHFLRAPLCENIPVLMALLNVWYINFLRYPTQVVMCYANSMRLFPKYLQQIVMESSAKCLDASGNKLTYETAVPLWGGVGSNDQHTFFQWLYQSKQPAFCDFIAFADVTSNLPAHAQQLLAHSITQAQALMQPATDDVVGNRPSTFLLCKTLTPYTLGMLMALYEYRVLVEGLLWNVPTYEQGGVEHAKNLPYVDILRALENPQPATQWDDSTNGLIKQCQRYKETR